MTPPSLAKRCVAEFVGTFGLVFAGTGAVVVNQASGGQITHLGVGTVFGLVVTAMIYATGHLSGAHLNPAVTIAFGLVRHFSPREIPQYCLAQLAGAAAASLALEGLLGRSGTLGATLPAAGAGQAWGMEFALTFILMFVIMAVATDTRNAGSAAAVAIGATVALEAIFGGPISGASMNPARSFGPALVAGVWEHFWVYVTAPVAGAAAAAALYQWLRGHEHAVRTPAAAAGAQELE
ncbi:MAG: aquaporin [Chloroflexota bacterium]